MYDQTTQFARDNLARQIERVNRGEASEKAIRIAAEQLLRVTTPAAIEDREYGKDLALPISARCGERGQYGRVCSRRANHVSPDHRDIEYSWTSK